MYLPQSPDPTTAPGCHLQQCSPTPHFIQLHPSCIQERFKKKQQNLHKAHRPIQEGKILIQHDCSFGNFLLLKEKHEQNPFSLGEKQGNQAQIRRESRNGSRHHPLPRLNRPPTNCFRSVQNNTGSSRSQRGCDGKAPHQLIWVFLNKGRKKELATPGSVSKKARHQAVYEMAVGIPRDRSVHPGTPCPGVCRGG